MHVAKSRHDDDFFVVPLVIFQACNRELEQEGKDLDNGGVFVIRLEDLTTKCNWLYALTSAELSHSHKCLQLVIQLWSDAHGLSTHQLDDCTPRKQLLLLDFELLSFVAAQDLAIVIGQLTLVDLDLLEVDSLHLVS
jgi:hypothetical protein